MIFTIPSKYKIFCLKNKGVIAKIFLTCIKLQLVKTFINPFEKCSLSKILSNVFYIKAHF